MRRSWRLANGWPVLALAVAATPAAVHGQSEPAPAGGPRPTEQLVQVRTLADVQQVGPDQTFHLAVVFDIKPQWHIYWKNPGEGALSPRITVHAPRGFRVGKTLWPRPTVIRTPMGDAYGYREQAVLFVPIEAPSELADGRVVLDAEIRWAVCKDVCVLGSARRSVAVETASRLPEPPQPIDPVLAKYKKRLPRPLDTVPGASLAFDGAMLTITGPAGGKKKAAFFPGQSPGVTYGKAEVAIRDDRFRVVVKVEVKPHNAVGEPMVLGGLVVLGEKADDGCYDFRLPLSMGQ